jgi:hypothetical protein
MSIDDFPMISLPPTMTDSDVEFHSDLVYMRALRQEIAQLSYETGYQMSFPVELSDALADLSDKVKAVKW